MIVHTATTDEEILACFRVVGQLRPHLTSDEFLRRVRLQQGQGYQLAFLATAKGPVAVAGYRIIEKLSSGRVLHVDDLVTDAAVRSTGFGARMLSWLRHQAEEASCHSLQLDCGIQRRDSHRFYEREGLQLSAYHFDVKIL